MDANDYRAGAEQEFYNLIKTNNFLINKNLNIDECFSFYDAIIKEKYGSDRQKSAEGALNKIHGDWYEWIIALVAWNLFYSNKIKKSFLLLPNVSSFDVSRLYELKIYEMILDLKNIVKESADVSLVTSNPDMVIVNGVSSEEFSVFDFNNPTGCVPILENAYLNLIGKCKLDDILGYLSIKSSLRPDRRLQIPHEGSLMKAIYAHIQTRLWNTKPLGLKYYAVSKKISDADTKALKTVATHSITTVSSLPISAVDKLFECKTVNQIESMILEICG